MPDRAPYSFGAAPLQDPIVPKLYLTDAWRNWFIDLQRQFLVRWDDLRMPAQAIDPVGGVGSAGRDTASGLLAFSGVADNAIGGVAQMPHGWLPGSVIRPHIHLRFPNANPGTNTRWQFGYDIANRDEDWTNASGTYTLLPAVTVANPDNVNRHVHADLGDLDMTGFRESACILWSITRLALTDVADTDNQTCLLVEFDIHHQLNKLGSVPEHP